MAEAPLEAEPIATEVHCGVTEDSCQIDAGIEVVEGMAEGPLEAELIEHGSREVQEGTKISSQP